MALIDIAATAAAWSRVDDPNSARGTTVGCNVTFLTGAHGQDVVAAARILRRGRSITVCDVDVTSNGGAVAKAQVIYKLETPKAAT